MALIEYTFSDDGLAALSYNGVSYISSAQPRLFEGAVMRIGSAGAETAYSGQDTSAATTKSHTSNSVTQVYTLTAGVTITLIMTLEVIDRRTVTLHFSFLNGDPTRNMARVAFDWIINLPSAITRRSDGTVFPVRIGGRIDGAYTVPSFVIGGAWGSLGLWPGAYDTTDKIYIEAVESPLRLQVSNAIGTPQETPTVFEETPVAAGETWSYDLTMRFGPYREVAVKYFTPEAFRQVRAEFPQLINWIDKRPISRLFLSEFAYRSSSNPRGYLYDAGLNAIDIPTFRAALTSYVSYRITNNLDLMNPKPQGVIVWDLEGNEFGGFVYGGCPDQMAFVSPEMEACADDMFALFAAAGYRFGMTIRPDNVDHSSPHDHSQVSTQDEALAILDAKISYAINRWGEMCSIFYIDSTGIDTSRVVSQKVYQTLMERYPNILLIPETPPALAAGCTMDYRDGRYEPLETDRGIYYHASSYLVPDISQLGDEDYYDGFVQALLDGSITFVEMWYWPDFNNTLLQACRDAGITN